MMKKKMNKNILFIILIAVIGLFDPFSALGVICCANAIVQYKGQPKSDSWVRWIYAKVMKRNQNALISIVGRTGSGKTLSGLSIAHKLSKLTGVPFTIDHVVFSLTELMKLINSGKLKKGNTILFDEPQISISSREFMSSANKIFNYLLSTFRHKNLVLLFCTPFESMLDKNTRKLFHARFETLSIDKNRQVCRIKPRYVEHSDFREQPYRKCLIVLSKNKHGRNQANKLSYWDVQRPPKELEEQYEVKKLEFTDNLNKNIQAKLQEYDESGKSMTSDASITPHKPLTAKQIEIGKKYQELGQVTLTAEALGSDISIVSRQLASVRKKGYNIQKTDFDQLEAK